MSKISLLPGCSLAPSLLKVLTASHTNRPSPPQPPNYAGQYNICYGTHLPRASLARHCPGGAGCRIPHLATGTHVCAGPSVRLLPLQPHRATRQARDPGAHLHHSPPTASSSHAHLARTHTHTHTHTHTCDRLGWQLTIPSPHSFQPKISLLKKSQTRLPAFFLSSQQHRLRTVTIVCRAPLRMRLAALRLHLLTLARLCSCVV